MLKNASKYSSDHTRHLCLLNHFAGCMKNSKLRPKSSKSVKFEASDRQWTPSRRACDPSLGSSCGAHRGPPLTTEIRIIFKPPTTMIMMRNILENQGRSMCIECVRTSTASVIMKGLSSKMMAPTAASAAAKLASSCTVQRTCMTAAHSRHCWPRLRATCPAASTADCHPRTVAAAQRSLEGVPACAASGLKYGCTRLHLRVLYRYCIQPQYVLSHCRRMGASS